MRLIIHLGFHKTASTYLQHLLNGNAGALIDRGIWYQHQAGYPAHHFAAWALMLGDAMQLEVMIRNAAAHNCHSVILSSEDLEAAPFNPQITALIEATAARLGVTEIEWHIVLREPGAYFSSLHAQLQHHVYADSLAMVTEVMRKGMLFIADPLAGAAGTPYWFYCFDHHRHIGAFAANTRHPVIVHDYADADPYPGWRLVDRLGALDAIVALPDGEGMNRRLESAAVSAGYHQRVVEALGDHPVPLVEVDACLKANMAAVPAFAAAVGERFGDSYRAALSDFGAAVPAG